MTKWRVNERTMEASNHTLHHGGIVISDWFSDKLEIFKMSNLAVQFSFIYVY